MAKQSYKITVEGKADLVNVACILEFVKAVQMQKETSTKWVGTIKDIEVHEKLDYELFISAVGKVPFTYTIHNTRVNNEVEKDDDSTDLKIQNGAIIRSSCKAE